MRSKWRCHGDVIKAAFWAVDNNAFNGFINLTITRENDLKKYLFCNTCKTSIRRNKIPTLALIEGLHFPDEILDILSYELLNKSMSVNEKNTLKLSLSNIISFAGPTVNVFEAFFFRQSSTVQKLYQEAKLKVAVLPLGMSEATKMLVNDILLDDKNELYLRRIINKKKSEVLETTSDGEAMGVLDVIEFVLQCTKQKDWRHTS